MSSRPWPVRIAPAFGAMLSMSCATSHDGARHADVCGRLVLGALVMQTALEGDECLSAQLSEGWVPSDDFRVTGPYGVSGFVSSPGACEFPRLPYRPGLRDGFASAGFMTTTEEDDVVHLVMHTTIDFPALPTGEPAFTRDMNVDVTFSNRDFVRCIEH